MKDSHEGGDEDGDEGWMIDEMLRGLWLKICVEIPGVSVWWCVGGETWLLRSKKWRYW